MENKSEVKCPELSLFVELTGSVGSPSKEAGLENKVMESEYTCFSDVYEKVSWLSGRLGIDTVKVVYAIWYSCFVIVRSDDNEEDGASPSYIPLGRKGQDKPNLKAILSKNLGDICSLLSRSDLGLGESGIWFRDNSSLLEDSTKIKMSAGDLLVCVESAKKFKLIHTSPMETEYVEKCLFRRFETLLDEILANPDRPIGDSVIISDEELEYLKIKGNFDESKIEADDLLARIRRKASKNPGSMAIKQKSDCITYEELDSAVNSTRNWLTERGVGEGDSILILGSEKVEIVYLWLGALSLGANFTTLAADLNTSRIEYISNDIQAQLILVLDKELDINEIGKFEYFSKDFLSDYSSDFVEDKTNQNRAAYYIYTSGSTGKPKGVEISVAALNNYSQSISRHFEQDAELQFGFLANLSADLAYTSIFGALFSGNTIRLIAREKTDNPELLFSELEKDPVDYLKIVPSYFQALFNSATAYDWIPQKCVIFGGEQLQNELVSKLGFVKPELKIMNHYGPTESTVGALVNTKVSVDSEKYAQIPVGAPLEGYSAVVVDSDLRPVPCGKMGQLLIGGTSLASKYLNNQDLTNEKFRDLDLFGSTKRYYLTGDVFSISHEGTFCFHRRLDNQVKIRGYRIELGEIDNAIMEWDQVLDCASIVLGESENAYIKTYVKSSDGMTESDLQAKVKTVLPEYMCPSSFEFVSDIPRLMSGKVDRKALLKDVTAETSYTVKEDSTLEKLKAIWSQLLKNDNLSEDDNYFDMGANSLLVIKARKEITEHFDVDVKLVELFKYTTVNKLSEFISSKLPKQEVAPEVDPVSVALTSIWSNLLKKSDIESTDNFFDMGANSLMVISARKKIQSELGVDIKLVEFFKYTTIEKLAELINERN